MARKRTVKSRFVELFQKHEKGERYTDAEKVFIALSCEKAGIQFVPTKCEDCYFDKVVQLCNVEKVEQIKSGECHEKNVLREPFATQGIRINGQYVSQATMTNKMADYMRSVGLGKFFVK